MTAHKPEHEVLYFQVTDLWRRLCEEHSLLLDQTCDEYSLLLSSDLDGLDDKVAQKQNTIDRINDLDALRQTLMSKLSQSEGREIGHVQELVEYINKLPIERQQKHFFRFNAILLDIIEKIQAQNKKNQIFLNKAIHSLKEIRQDAMGKKNYSTYNAKGTSRVSPHF